MKFICAVFLLLGANAAWADFSCKLSSNNKYSSLEDEDELLIRSRTLNTKAILITKYGPKVFNCVDAILHEYECYGFMEKPFEAPMQLNVIGDGMHAGTEVIHTVLNLGFLGEYSSNRYVPSDFETRRFSIDTYTVKHCD